MIDLADPALWTCPICRARHAEAQARCRRCGADLLILVACRWAAGRLAAAGDTSAAALVAAGDAGAAGDHRQRLAEK